MARMSDMMPVYISEDRDVYGWETTAGPILLDMSRPLLDEVVVEGRSMSVADAQSLMLGLVGVMSVVSGKIRETTESPVI